MPAWAALQYMIVISMPMAVNITPGSIYHTRIASPLRSFRYPIFVSLQLTYPATSTRALLGHRGEFVFALVHSGFKYLRGVFKCINEL